jgi:hypothetical protein
MTAPQSPQQKQIPIDQAYNTIVNVSRQFKGNADEHETITASLLALKGLVEQEMIRQQSAAAPPAAQIAPTPQPTTTTPAESTPAS